MDYFRINMHTIAVALRNASDKTLSKRLNMLFLLFFCLPISIPEYWEGLPLPLFRSSRDFSDDLRTIGREMNNDTNQERYPHVYSGVPECFQRNLLPVKRADDCNQPVNVYSEGIQSY